jgi:ABC-type Fe3+ transport system permease subunit
METKQIIIIMGWMILGLINVIILYYIQKKHSEKLTGKIPPGFLEQTAVLIIWFCFAFIIIPYYLIIFYSKYIYFKLIILENKLKDYILNKIKK